MWRLTASGPTARVTSMPVTAADAKDPAAKLRGSAVPWRRMLLHPAVWAIVINNYTFHYAFYVVMNWLPLTLSRYSVAI
ncbi:hypothetical protein WJX84_001460 [Apatococcus fuscideae]|uniref:MFS transporter n=1 Tax=Apatococcus fuscideae TaxID=2026836 RepID=A0AAW1SQ43_9CHLO